MAISFIPKENRAVSPGGLLLSRLAAYGFVSIRLSVISPSLSLSPRRRRERLVLRSSLAPQPTPLFPKSRAPPRSFSIPFLIDRSTAATLIYVPR